MSSASNKQLPAKPRPKKGEAEAVKGTSKVRGAVGAKENVRDCDCVCSDEVCCDAMVTPQRSPPQQTKGKPQSHKTDSSRPNGNIKTYIFGEQPTGEPTKKKRALKERQCHLAVASPRSQGRGHKAREGHARALSTEFATEKRQKRGSSAGLLRTSFKASARKYKDNVVHTYRKRHPKHDKHHDAYGSAGRHFVHQIPRVVISCENLTESRKANSLSRIRDSFRRRPAASDPRCTHVQESGEESANEHSRRSRPRDARDFLREEDESPEKCRGKSRSHSTTREDRRAPYENLERSKSVHAKRRTPRRDSPSLSDDLYVRRKSRGPRIDLAKMR
ncbi:serine/arginine repetitive matrix protein 5-like [Penaeus chinensis]|uniref:serine/arginine repetitive matrix protein 5-like n=1 Tax=Penaeus chinensis TaxID=139456 RepID=UPI001FB588A0|nr:serine/arginine repetitive matrix protein 5-like [Penaeus chinensis]